MTGVHRSFDVSHAFSRVVDYSISQRGSTQVAPVRLATLGGFLDAVQHVGVQPIAGP
jgi:hypothetical protein